MTIYPLIQRLKQRRLLHSKPGKDRRGTEHLVSTKLGHEAVRQWLMESRPNHLLLEDPLRTKVQSFELLSKEEQLECASSDHLRQLAPSPVARPDQRLVSPPD